MDRAREAGVAATTTFLFTDLVGSTELIGRLGDDGAHAIRRAHFTLLRRAVDSLAGQEVKNLGDGLMIAFASSLDAVACAVAMQRAVRRHNEARPSAGALGVRIGVHVGEPVREDADFFGSVVVVAKRLCDHAAGGQILTSELVRALVGSRGGHVFRAAGDLAVKGLAEPVPTALVVWEHGAGAGAAPRAARRGPAPAGARRGHGRRHTRLPRRGEVPRCHDGSRHRW